MAIPSLKTYIALTVQVLKALMPSLLMLIGDNKAVAAQTVPREIKLIKDHATSFVM